jgi:Ser/Thr protein kinase RdoA (MazF antagonist)
VRDIHLLWPYVHGKVKAVLGDDVDAYGSAWVKRVPEMMNDLSTRAHCLIHGDFHGDNVRFQGDDALILDFGESFRGNPMYDVSKLLMTSAHRVPDEAMLRQGVSTWHAAATEYGLTGYSHEQAWNDFLAVAPLDFALGLRIAIQQEDDERRRETSQRRSDRVLGALRSLGELPAA